MSDFLQTYKLLENGIDISPYSVYPEGAHHVAVVRMHSNRKVTCSWRGHSGAKPCPHTVLWSRKLNLSLRRLRRMHDEYYRQYYGSERDTFVFVPACHSYEYIPFVER